MVGVVIETVADLVRQLESPNGAPSAVFMPLVNAVLKKQGFDLSNSPQMKPPAFARSLPSGTPDAKRNLAAVQKVLRNLRSWGIEELPRHVRPDFCDAIAEIDSLLVTGWTEVDEALTRIELGTSFLAMEQRRRMRDRQNSVHSLTSPATCDGGRQNNQTGTGTPFTTLYVLPSFPLRRVPSACFGLLAPPPAPTVFPVAGSTATSLLFPY